MFPRCFKFALSDRMTPSAYPGPTSTNIFLFLRIATSDCLKSIFLNVGTPQLPQSQSCRHRPVASAPTSYPPHFLDSVPHLTPEIPKKFRCPSPHRLPRLFSHAFSVHSLPLRRPYPSPRSLNRATCLLKPQPWQLAASGASSTSSASTSAMERDFWTLRSATPEARLIRHLTALCVVVLLAVSFQ